MDINKLFPIREFYQGDDWNFNLLLNGYDPSLYTLTYMFKKANAEAFSFSSIVSNESSFNMVVASAVTALYPAGLYYVTAFVVENATTFKTTLGQTEIQIKADISTDNNDPRSMNRIALEAVEAALAAGAGSDVQEYTVGGTTVKKNREGLLKLRAYYLQRVKAEDKKPALSNILYNL